MPHSGACSLNSSECHVHYRNYFVFPVSTGHLQTCESISMSRVVFIEIHLLSTQKAVFSTFWSQFAKWSLRCMNIFSIKFTKLLPITLLISGILGEIRAFQQNIESTWYLPGKKVFSEFLMKLLGISLKGNFFFKEIHKTSWKDKELEKLHQWFL